jgi:hypothetical protein
MLLLIQHDYYKFADKKQTCYQDILDNKQRIVKNNLRFNYELLRE